MTIDFAKLTPKQLAVFEQVAVNNDSGHPPKTLESLEKKGYLQSNLEQLRGHPPVAVTRYSVPIPVHIAWCQWCAEQQEEEEGKTIVYNGRTHSDSMDDDGTMVGRYFQPHDTITVCVVQPLDGNRYRRPVYALLGDVEAVQS